MVINDFEKIWFIEGDIVKISDFALSRLELPTKEVIENPKLFVSYLSHWIPLLLTLSCASDLTDWNHLRPTVSINFKLVPSFLIRIQVGKYKPLNCTKEEDLERQTFFKFASSAGCKSLTDLLHHPFFSPLGEKPDLFSHAGCFVAPPSPFLTVDAKYYSSTGDANLVRAYLKGSKSKSSTCVSCCKPNIPEKIF